MMILAFAWGAFAQDSRPTDGQPQEPQRPGANQPQDVRGNALRQLGLSREQIQQIRRLNADRKPVMDEAQKRFHLANRALDEAIYADQVNETDVQARLKEVQLAQAEVAKIRFTHEFAVRRILTSEQLLRFRELRQRFEQVRQNLENRPRDDANRRPNDQTPANTKPFQEKPLRPMFQQDKRKPNL